VSPSENAEVGVIGGAQRGQVSAIAAPEAASTTRPRIALAVDVDWAESVANGENRTTWRIVSIDMRRHLLMMICESSV
jgi:hypothetical protein